MINALFLAQNNLRQPKLSKKMETTTAKYRMASPDPREAIKARTQKKLVVEEGVTMIWPKGKKTWLPQSLFP